MFVRNALRFSVFISLCVGTIVALPIWRHHSIKVESPVFPSEAAAQEWIVEIREKEGPKCLASSVKEQVQIIADGSGWFSVFRCNTPRKIIVIAMSYLAPGIFFLLVLAAVGKSNFRRTVKL